MSGNLLNAIKLNNVQEAIEDVRNGKIIIVVDDEDRENEGDFICAAQSVTPEIINFIATHGRGLICAPIEESRAAELGLNMMVSKNTAAHETAFTVSIDLLGNGCSTGISAYDRATGIKALTDKNIQADNFARPGHIFPLKAKNGGILRRTGHTEAAVDIARMAGFYPAGVLVEILNGDGTMARLPELCEIASKFNLKIISIKDLVAYRLHNESIVRKESTTEIESDYGITELNIYQDLTSDDIHYALKFGNWNEDEDVPVRVQTIQSTSDFLKFLLQPDQSVSKKALNIIAKEKKGLFLLMKQQDHENKISDELNYIKNKFNIDKVSVDNAMEQRDFGIGAQIIRDMGIRNIKLITNGVQKRIGLEGYGLTITSHLLLN